MKFFDIKKMVGRENFHGQWWWWRVDLVERGCYLLESSVKTRWKSNTVIFFFFQDVENDTRVVS